MIHTTRACVLAIILAAATTLGVSGPTQADTTVDRDAVLLELRTRVATAESISNAAGGYTMRFVSAADKQERACVAIDVVANVAAVQRIHYPGCGAISILFTALASYSRFTSAAAFGERRQPDKAALRLLGRPGARWVKIVPDNQSGPVSSPTAEFAIGAMIESALFDVAVITDAEVTAAQITLTGHPRQQPARTSTLRFSFAGDRLTQVVTTGRDASRVTFDYTRPELTTPPVDQVVPLERYLEASAVTGAVHQARSATPGLRRAVVRRGPGISAITALRDAVVDWRSGSLDRIKGIPSFTQTGRIPGGVVVITKNRFGRVAVELTWRPIAKKVGVRVKSKVIHRAT